MNAHKGILITPGFAYQELDTDIAVRRQRQKTDNAAGGNVAWRINDSQDVAEDVNRY